MTDPGDGGGPGHDDVNGRVLAVYVHLTAQTPRQEATAAQLARQIDAYAESAGFAVGPRFVATEGEGDLQALHDLVQELHLHRIRTVLIAGPAARLLRVLDRLDGVEAITLATLRP